MSKSKIAVLFLIGVFVVMESSCITNGYGCKGNSRIITRVR